MKSPDKMNNCQCTLLLAQFEGVRLFTFIMVVWRNPRWQPVFLWSQTTQDGWELLSLISIVGSKKWSVLETSTYIFVVLQFCLSCSSFLKVLCIYYSSSCEPWWFQKPYTLNSYYPTKEKLNMHLIRLLLLFTSIQYVCARAAAPRGAPLRFAPKAELIERQDDPSSWGSDSSDSGSGDSGTSSGDTSQPAVNDSGSGTEHQPAQPSQQQPAQQQPAQPFQPAQQQPAQQQPAQPSQPAQQGPAQQQPGQQQPSQQPSGQQQSATSQRGTITNQQGSTQGQTQQQQSGSGLTSGLSGLSSLFNSFLQQGSSSSVTPSQSSTSDTNGSGGLCSTSSGSGICMSTSGSCAGSFVAGACPGDSTVQVSPPNP